MSKLTEIHKEDVRIIAMNIPCAWCQAAPGEPCTEDGKPLQMSDIPVSVHVSRIAPVWVIYKIGYRKGRRDMKKEIRSELNRVGLDL